ncbi:MAG TPA: hypothetical protein VFU02_08925 [Polyangiaceae bacterium]|nr:hypothetical protein [Polyangiaceae bacterium]
MSHIHFVGGEKGGVGKSVTARLLAQWFIDHSQSFAGIDADQSHGVLLRFYSEYTRPVYLTQPESADQIMDRALGAERQVLVDLPGQSIRPLHAWLTGADILQFSQEVGVRFSFWHVTDGSYASVSEVDELIELYGDKVRHVVVKNFGRGKDFSLFDASEAKQRLDELKGSVVELPELDATAMLRIDAMGASFWAAANSTDGPFTLRALERQRVRLWLKLAYAAVGPVLASG